VPSWLILALAALVVWSVQRAVSKMALVELSTPQFYLLSAVVSLPIYLPVLAFDPPPLSALPPALGLSALMAVTFGVTTEAIRRGPVGRVSPITGLSPALTAILALAVLDENVGSVGVLGIACATIAVALLGYRPGNGSEPVKAGERWLGLTLASLALQGVGAFIAKVVVTPSGPSALLVASASVQVVVGSFLLRRSNAPFPSVRPRLIRLTTLVLVLAAVATTGYLFALSQGPAAIIVPLVATSPALGGLLGGMLLNERLGRLQCAGVALGLLAAVLLAAQG
jgi:drug/metabolite transporter (DMT)-like permease